MLFTTSPTTNTGLQ